MTEFRSGIFQSLRKLLSSSSALRATIYTLGHIVIAIVCNQVITGTSLELAALDAVVEPVINGLWYYVLDRLLVKRS